METNKQQQGLTQNEVIASRKLHGSNVIEKGSNNKFFHVVKDVVLEPLFLILLGVSSIYFILEKPQEGFLMIGALILVSGISLFQESKSRNAVEALKKLSSPKAKVRRDGNLIELNSEELVVGDILLLEDGNVVPADAILLELHDFLVNESILTGESLPVEKSLNIDADQKIFQGTLVQTGSCIACITAVGAFSELGKIGKSLLEVETVKTPLQQQISGFVKNLVIAGMIAFVLVFGINLYLSKEILHALLHGLTLAMSVIPEEIPVALSTFMALGAYRMYQKKVIVRSPHTVETLGTATVICADKTGTLTDNRMELRAVYDFKEHQLHDFSVANPSYTQVLEYAVWSSEVDPFDPMEKAIHQWYGKLTNKDERKHAKLVHEYPLSGDPPIMTHMFLKQDGEYVLAVKGSAEGVIALCGLNQTDKDKIHVILEEQASRGFRLLAVGCSNISYQELPKTQHEIQFEFLGLLAFYDPPKAGIAKVLHSFYEAGIKVKMITGDHLQTACSIAEQIELMQGPKALSGAEVMAMDDGSLDEAVRQTTIFARMFPEAKLRIIEALRRNGEIVAMTGDGVNDGPALKAAHIGIAMGKRGSEVARNTASLILVDDNLSHLVDAVALGRRIYENLRKAIRYILSIHIPIILIVTLPFLVLGPGLELFSPIHVIFLELIMGPTCSIIFENEPIEKNSMKLAPPQMGSPLFSWPELRLSIIQGLVITAVCFVTGYLFIRHYGYSEELVRTVVFSTLIFSNLFLTLVNRSFKESIFYTIQYKNKLVPVILLLSLFILLLSLYFEPVRQVFQLCELTVLQLVFCLLAGFIGVIWIDFFKGKKV
ncbi:MAG: cation-translocating P-type ATPase [bacterium]|nr:cation-translocating P-type ATPase [bacterium]